jgi:DNA replication protein DnaC
MLTTNLAFEEWTEVFGSERLTGALLDRLIHRCHILEANGESYRLRQARKRSPWKPSSRQDPNPNEKDK